MENIEKPHKDDGAQKALDIATFITKWFFKNLRIHATYYQLRFYLQDTESKKEFVSLLEPLMRFFQRLPKESKKDRFEKIYRFYKEVLDIDFLYVKQYRYFTIEYLTEINNGDLHSLMYMSKEVTTKLLIEKLKVQTGLYVDWVGNVSETSCIAGRPIAEHWFAYHDEMYSPLERGPSKSGFYNFGGTMAFDEWALVVLFKYWEDKSVWDKALGDSIHTIVPGIQNDKVCCLYYNGMYKVRFGRYENENVNDCARIRNVRRIY